MTTATEKQIAYINILIDQWERKENAEYYLNLVEERTAKGDLKGADYALSNVYDMMAGSLGIDSYWLKKDLKKAGGVGDKTEVRAKLDEMYAAKIAEIKAEIATGLTMQRASELIDGLKKGFKN